METKFVAILIFSVFLWVDLDSIIGKMNKLVISFAQLKLETAGTNIALVVPIALYFTIESHQQHIAANIKFSLVI